MKTIIIIPCYNEEHRLRSGEFLDYIRTHLDTAFLFVNDGSRDNTLKIIQSLSLQNERLMYLHLPQNGGKAEAVRQGILYASQQWQPENIGFWDADLSTPLSEIAYFIRQMKESGRSMIIGMRIKRLGAEVQGKTSRSLLGRLFATTVSAMINLPTYDTQCGAKLFKTSLAASLFREPFISKWLFDIELLARYVQLAGMSTVCAQVYEYPVHKWRHVEGSKLKLPDFLLAPWELLKIRQKYINKRVLRR
ncbi:MAG: glycosyltransferase [Tannerella sp.]|jgi:glycosyltransferase involved in cell wall biosynthesis|nr:glycosyltransferase [Tannerella sp.]